VAKERNIQVSEIRHERTAHYKTLLRITLDTDKGKQEVAGTLFGDKPRIVSVNGVPLEAALGTRMLYVNNEDKPGLIGNLGQLLGDAKVNIANFHLGRTEDKSDAVALLEVDQEVSPELIAKIGKLPSVKNVRLLVIG